MLFNEKELFHMNLRHFAKEEVKTFDRRDAIVFDLLRSAWDRSNKMGGKNKVLERKWVLDVIGQDPRPLKY